MEYKEYILMCQTNLSHDIVHEIKLAKRDKKRKEEFEPSIEKAIYDHYNIQI